jgi:predicted alpha/beta-fold hydrolase
MNQNMIDLKSRLEATRRSLAPCIPPFWASSGHGQTILGHLLPSPRVRETGEVLSVSLEKETERIHSTYLRGSTNIVVYFFHGLGGSAEATYMQRSALRAQAMGHHVFLNNHRGCGAGAGLATEPYHSGRADDLSKVIKFGRARLPGHRHIAVGFSLSANALLLLAAKFRAEVLPDGAIAVNAPINLDRASIKLQEGLNRIYDKSFTLELAHYIRRNRPADAGKLSKIRDLREFDEVLTAPLGGFRDRADYYATCSAKAHVGKISIPTVVLTAEDDPFVSVEDYREAQFSEHCFVHIEGHGGHMGYLIKRGLGYARWLDQALDAYLVALAQA